uniref:Reverse transcriptase Ty1/copia-type domain-containing protein n=1 Tax=Cajanus cajan TaxID=3821 RepID=A0A151S571_CAJCA|nr:hypothetical protein KK1_028281 [Cajanus cajan]
MFCSSLEIINDYVTPIPCRCSIFCLLCSVPRWNPSLFISHTNSRSIILLLYVDDILLTGSSTTLVSNFINLLQYEFSMKDLGPLHHFSKIGTGRSQVWNGPF